LLGFVFAIESLKYFPNYPLGWVLGKQPHIERYMGIEVQVLNGDKENALCFSHYVF
jgi:hypothetical protein